MSNNHHSFPIVLTIAGFDPSCGAGIGADLKTFAAQGCYGIAAVTAITVQTTEASSGIATVMNATVNSP